MGPPPPPRLDRIHVIATVVGVLAAFAGTWGVKVAMTRWRAEEMMEAITAGWSHVDTDTRRRLGRVIEREMRPLLAHPNVANLELGARASLWLPDADLLTYQSLRKRLAFASERACACLWTGGCAQSDVIYGVAELPNEDVELWYRLLARAGRAQLDGAAPFPVDESELGAGTDVILRAMSDADRDRFAAVSQGRATTISDKCFALRALFTGIEAFEPARRARFTRAMLSADPTR